MAGGSGERFWPLSRKHRPKQLLRLTDSNRTMLAEAFQRAEPLFGRDRLFLATTKDLAEKLTDDTLQIDPKHILAEPLKRNTAGALVWAVAQLIAIHGDELTIAVLTSDHAIRPGDAFRDTVAAALDTAEQTGHLGTIGIRPCRPATGFGYIEFDPEGTVGRGDARRVRRFLEKPSEESAVRMVSSGQFLWNSGMFFWTAGAFRAALRAASPEHGEALEAIVEAVRSNRPDLAEAAFEALPDISIDYALMERAPDVFVIEAGFEWDDLGAWDALGRRRPETDNVTVGDVVALDSSDSVVWSETGQKVCTIGVHGYVLVVTEDAILLMPKERAQDVRKAVAHVRETNPDLI